MAVQQAMDGCEAQEAVLRQLMRGQLSETQIDQVFRTVLERSRSSLIDVVATRRTTAPPSAIGEEQNCVGTDANRQLTEMTAAQRLELVSCVARIAANRINGQTPLRVDEVTTVQSALSTGGMLIYSMRVDIDEADVNDEWRGRIEQATRHNVCANSDMHLTLRLAGAYMYMWFDRNQRLLHRVRVDSCPRLTQ